MRRINSIDDSTVSILGTTNTENRLFFENFIAPEYITTPTAARMLGVSENALRIKVCRGQIPAYKFGSRLRFKVSEIKSLFLPKE